MYTRRWLGRAADGQRFSFGLVGIGVIGGRAISIVYTGVAGCKLSDNLYLTSYTELRGLIRFFVHHPDCDTRISSIEGFMRQKEQSSLALS